MGNSYSLWKVITIPHLEQISDNKYLSAIRQTFYVLMPFWLTLSFFDILGNLFLNPTGILFSKDGLNLGFWLTEGLTGEDYLQNSIVQILLAYKKIIGAIYGIIAFILTTILSGKLAEIWKSEKNSTQLCSIITLLLISTLTNPTSTDAMNYFSEVNLSSAFFVAFATSKLFAWLYSIKKLNWKSKLLPKNLANYILVTPQILLTVLIFSIFTLLLSFAKVYSENFLMSLSDVSMFQNPFVVICYEFLVWSLWWLGIPGYSLTSSIQEYVYMPAQISNQIGDTAAVFTTGFFEAEIIHVLGLMIAILVFSRHEQWRGISKITLPLMAFNVQELFVFGLPVVLNPIFLVPYIFAPIANTFVGWVAISWGIVPPFQSSIPWTMPLFFGAAISTHSIMGGVLQIVWLVMDIFIYAPFVITANAIEFDDEKKAVKNFE